MKKAYGLFTALGLLAAVFLTGCVTSPPPAGSPSYDYAGMGESSASRGGRAYAPPSAPSSSIAEPPSEGRPGLGTEWGETRTSRTHTIRFARAEPNSPLAVGRMHYNDEEGAYAMAGVRVRAGKGVFPVGNDLISIGLRKPGWGGYYRGFSAGGANYVIGRMGERYIIEVRNHTDSRLEVVLSVDGLDVLDGKPASYGKRGYLIWPNDKLVVEGFRKSLQEVAAFRFGSVSDSYANRRHGDTRNVGVIGAAVFHERGSRPWQWNDEEARRRRGADPFPNRFATPPPR